MWRTVLQLTKFCVKSYYKLAEIYYISHSFNESFICVHETLVYAVESLIEKFILCSILSSIKPTQHKLHHYSLAPFGSADNSTAFWCMLLPQLCKTKTH